VTISTEVAQPLHITARQGETRAEWVYDIASRLGRPLWPWQYAVLEVACERGANGRWRYPLVLTSVPRQSGKTTLVVALAIARCLSAPDQSVWYTAQSRQDAVLRFREMVKLLRASDYCEGVWRGGQLVGDWDYRVFSSLGNESIAFRNGSVLSVFAPADDSLHGTVTDLVIIDEARFFAAARGAALIDAALPTQATRDGQVWITSTAGGPESTFLSGLMESGLESLNERAPRMAYCEYGVADDVPDGDLLDAVWAAHPSAGMPGGIVRDAVEVAYERMPAHRFAHEYGNRWRVSALSSVLPIETWDYLVAESLPAEPVTFAVDIALDRSQSVIMACAGATLEVVDMRSGAGWVPARIAELVHRHTPRAVVCDKHGPSGPAADAIRQACPEVLLVPTYPDVQVACAEMFDAVIDRRVFHLPNSELSSAIIGSTRRMMGQTWVWSRVGKGFVLMAATLALWGSTRTPNVVEESAIW
jgi:hypothetical protein